MIETVSIPGQEWLKEKLIALCIHTPLIDLEYEKMFDGLSAKQQNEILEAKENFQFKIKNVHTNPDVTAPKTLSVSDPEKSRCETVANLFRKDLEKNDIILKEAGKYGKILAYGSFRHKILFLLSDKIIVSGKHKDEMDVFGEQGTYMKDLYQFETVFWSET